ncbi:hypothetical protein [Neisseria dentiae]|nr:hypothetical protein [Neisseria dentiae]
MKELNQYELKDVAGGTRIWSVPTGPVLPALWLVERIWGKK